MCAMLYVGANLGCVLVACVCMRVRARVEQHAWGSKQAAHGLQAKQRLPLTMACPTIAVASWVTVASSSTWDMACPEGRGGGGCVCGGGGEA